VPQLDEPTVTTLAARLEHASAQMRNSCVPIHWVDAVALSDEGT
jgi:hypothetical protein